MNQCKHSPIIVQAEAESSFPLPDPTCCINDPQPSIVKWVWLNEDKKKVKNKRKSYELKKVSIGSPYDKKNFVPLPSKRSTMPILKEVPLNPFNKFIYNKINYIFISNITLILLHPQIQK